MKELKLPKPQEATTGLITDDSFIGVDFERAGKAIIIQELKGSYCALTRTITIWGNWVRPTKRAYVEALLTEQAELNHKVFMFDSRSDLISWWNR